MQGEPVLAREHLQQVVALYEPHRHRTLAVRCGYDPGVYAHTMEAWVLWMLGYPAQALQRSHEALTLARSRRIRLPSRSPWSRSSFCSICVGKEKSLWSTYRPAWPCRPSMGFPTWTAIGTVLQGWELTRVEQVTAGLTQMREGLAALRAMGAEILRPNMLALLADACERGGQLEDGLGALEEALVTAEQHTERFYEAELHRLKGELILRQWRKVSAKPASRDIQHIQASSGERRGLTPLQREAEVCFQQAMTIARRQQARSWELRAALSLGRLWQQQGQRAEAHALLAPIYGWFTEGFDTADLQEARALLDALA